MKLFQRLLVAPAALGLLSPLAANATEVNLNDISNYSDVDSIEFANSFDKDESTESELIAGGEGLIDYSGGDFSDTTTIDGKAIFTLGGVEYSKVKADGEESVTAAYTYQLNLNTSFNGDDNLYVRLKSGNHTNQWSGTKTFGTYLSAASTGGDSLSVDKIWYTLPVDDNNTVYVGPRVENYYMHGTTPSLYQPVTKQFTLGGNGNAYGASTNSGIGWAYKADNGLAVSSNFVSQQNATTNGVLTDEAKTSWATQVGMTKDTYSVSAIVNIKSNSWSDSYYHASGHAGSQNGTDPNWGGKTAIGLRAWWRPEDSGSATPSVSLGYDTTTNEGAAASEDNSTAWFAGLSWNDIFQADDKVGLAFGQPTTNESTTTDPFAYEFYYSFKANDSVEITPAIFGGSDRNGTAGDDVFGAVLQTTFKF